MTVEETGFMYADVTGHTHGGYDFLREYYGDAYAYGGQLAMSTNGVYGSILNPNMPGSYGGANDGNDQNLGGGLIKVTVEGTLALDGKATAIGGVSNNVRGTGGAINITAGNLTGAGSIAAHGFSVNTTRSSPTSNNNSDIKTPVGVRSHRNVKAASPGGRVAIRLTDKDATLSEHWSAVNSILAYGGNFTNSTTKAIDELYSASAGTIYIQEGDEEEGEGTIFVYNNNLVDNPAFTPIPSVKYNDGEDYYEEIEINYKRYETDEEFENRKNWIEYRNKEYEYLLELENNKNFNYKKYYKLEQEGILVPPLIVCTDRRVVNYCKNLEIIKVRLNLSDINKWINDFKLGIRDCNFKVNF